MIGHRGITTQSAGSRFRVGVNLSALDDGNPHATDATFPGTANIDYGIPTTAEMDYYKTKGWTFVRFAFLWERLQPAMNSSFDATFLGYITTIVNYAATVGMSCLIDCHNFGHRYFKQTTLTSDASMGAAALAVASLAGVSNTATLTMTYPTGGGNTADVLVSVSGLTVTLLGGATLSALVPSGSFVSFWDLTNTTNVPNSAFADLWSRLATVFVGNAGIAGYDLMNEPNAGGEASWITSANAAIAAIRLIDTQTYIYVEGYFFATAGSWTANNPTLATAITDSANRIVWSTHCYLDRDSSGTHYVWLTEVANGVTVTTGVTRLADFFSWAKTHGFTRLHLGEMGAGNDNIGWLTSLDNSFASAKGVDCEITYWVAGPFWGLYPYSVEQQSPAAQTGLFTQDAYQTAVLTKYTGAVQPSLYFIFGPSSGISSVASADFTIYYRGNIKTTVTITPSDSGAGGSFTPSTVTLAAGFNGLATFTYTAPGVNLFSISVTNTAGWANPASLGFSTQPDLYTNAAATAANILALRKTRGAYGGPLVRLQRASDSAQLDFAATSQAVYAPLDTVAITTWAGGSALTLVRWYSQDGTAQDGTAVTETGSESQFAGTLPTFIIDRGDGQPTVRFSGSSMDMISPYDGLTGFTVMAAMNLVSATANNELLGWDLIQHSAFPTVVSAANVWHTDVDTDVAMTLMAAPGIYMGRWAGNTVNGKRTYTNGTQIAQATTTRAALQFQFRSNVTIGWTRFAAPVLAADVSEIIVFSGAVSDSDITNFSADLIQAHNTPNAALALTISGGSFVPGKFGLALQAPTTATAPDILAQYYTTPVVGNVFILTQSYTVEFWTNSVTTVTPQPSTRYLINYGDVFNIGTFGNGTLFAEVYNGSGQTNFTSSINLYDGLNHHIALVVTTTNFTLYVDGVLIHTTTMTPKNAAGPTVYYGGATGTSAFTFPGWLDQIAIWKGARYTSGFTPSAVPYLGYETNLTALWTLDGNPSGLGTG